MSILRTFNRPCPCCRLSFDVAELDGLTVEQAAALGVSPDAEVCKGCRREADEINDSDEA